ncbi:SpoIID/LytB domain-containing protein [Sulfurimonas sp.]|uniref:SpoIID/LytB domain-containing protein n=1 Tax=Sulfurimonas sp. TaxID=2022749 RepID=UPI003D147895
MFKILLLPFLIFELLVAEVSTEVFSKWNINYGDLLVDQGKYLEAVDAYDSAFEATSIDTLKIEAMIREANVFSLYLDEKKIALDIYKKIYYKFPKRKEAEFALYQAGMLAKEMKDKEAPKLFEEYMKKYKNGKFYFQVKFLNDKLSKQTTQEEYPVKPTSEEEIGKNFVNIRVALHKTINDITLSGNLIVNNKKFPKVHCLYKNNKIMFNNQLFDKLTINSNEFIYVDSKKHKYRGYIELMAKENGILVLNVVDIESYIHGVVTSESISSWHPEALKSQAIASRTYAYYQAMVRKDWDYDVLDNTGDQVYKGLDGSSKSGVEATNATRGTILTYQNKPILAQYTASSGWRSSSSEEIFNVEKPYLYGHQDTFSEKMPLGRWDTEMSISEIESGLNKKGIKIGKLFSIEPVVIGPSGRITKVKFVGSNGEKTLKTYSSLRRIVGLSDILTTIEKRGNVFFFKGGGFGHGVGYSQWGGQAMAKAGYKYNEILKFYYKDVVFQQLF